MVLEGSVALLRNDSTHMNERLKLLPLLLLYILFVLLASENELSLDEPRYVMFANNLSHGYFSPRNSINLWNGPGYPIVLLPFVLLEASWLSARLLNALLLFGAVLYFDGTLRLYMPERHALRFAYLFGIYPPLFAHLHHLLTEPISLFLICGFVFHFCKLSQSKTGSWLHLILAGFFLGYLALTKVIFGYVILVSLMVTVLLYVWKSTESTKRTVWAFSVALIFCLPYLVYTYSLTGRFFYWANSGGMSLYWMSTPYEAELGDWLSWNDIEEDPSLTTNHKVFFEEVLGLPSIQRDDAFKRQAIRNISENPKKFVFNWVANVGRLLFNYPYSYTPQKLSTFAYLIPNLFIVSLLVLSIYPAYLGRRLIPYEIYFLMGFGIIAFWGSSLLSAYVRHSLPLVPVFYLWISFITTRVLRIEVRQQSFQADMYVVRGGGLEGDQQRKIG